MVSKQEAQPLHCRFVRTLKNQTKPTHQKITFLVCIVSIFCLIFVLDKCPPFWGPGSYYSNLQRTWKEIQVYCEIFFILFFFLIFPFLQTREIHFRADLRRLDSRLYGSIPCFVSHAGLYHVSCFYKFILFYEVYWSMRQEYISWTSRKCQQQTVLCHRKGWILFF